VYHRLACPKYLRSKENLEIGVRIIMMTPKGTEEETCGACFIEYDLFKRCYKTTSRGRYAYLSYGNVAEINQKALRAWKGHNLLALALPSPKRRVQYLRYQTFTLVGMMGLCSSCGLLARFRRLHAFRQLDHEIQN
jgi:hypothetical protein